ncbi:MAG: NAD(P)(+) transhydrogenase (Re/Si-specific) subunit beta, partial [Moraxellaceae bacterium]
MENFAHYADWAYLIGAVLFILALRGLSSPTSAIMGNRYGMIGMTLAVLATFAVVASLKGGVITVKPGFALIIGAMVLGAVIGLYRAKTVPMTQMPETVALMHSLVGLAAVLIAVAAVFNPTFAKTTVSRFELFVGCFVGAITFTASVIAWGKLSAKLAAKPLKGAWVKPVQAILFVSMLGFGIHYFVTDSTASFLIMTAIALVFGYFWIAPIGGGDMPVVVSLLNSLSGWAAAGIGFTLGNSMLIIAGSLVGSSGAILSYIMCRAMNRSLLNVLFGGFGASVAASADAGD